MNDENDMLFNNRGLSPSLGRYAHINVDRVNRLLTAMLALNAVGITAIAAMLGGEIDNLAKTSLIIFILSAIMAVFMFYILKVYLGSLQTKMFMIDAQDRERVVKIAREFYKPIVLSLLANIIMAVAGFVVLICHFALT